MALVGVVFMLGSIQAAAQTATYATNTVTVTMSSAVRVSSGTATDLAFTAFTIAGNPATAHAVDASAGGSATFTVTFTSNLAGIGTQMTYTAPSTGARIVDAVSGVAVPTFTVTVLPAQPVLPLIGNRLVERNSTVSIVLPEGVGGVAALTYSLTPAGGSANDPPLTGLTFTPSTRTIAGIPTDPVGTRIQLTYSATDGTNTAVGVAFYLEVTAARTTVDATGEVIGVGVKGSTRKTIGSDTRFHVTEGDLTSVQITGRWTNAQLTQLWSGRTLANPPDPAQVTIEVASVLVPGDDWLSPAETDQKPGNAQFGGQDAVLATTTVMVPIPDRPTRNTTSDLYADDSTGETSISFPRDIDAENEVFVINVNPISGGGLSVPAGEGTSVSHPIVIEDADTQRVTITRTPPPPGTVLPVITERLRRVSFDARAVPAREDLPLQVQYNLTDIGAASVSSRLYTVNRSTGTIPVGNLPTDVDTVVVNIPGNDRNRDDDELEIHAEVVSFSLASGAFTDIQSDSMAFTVLDVHRLPVLSVDPATGTVMEGGEIELTVEIDRNPPDTTSSATGETKLYSDEAVNIMVSRGATSTADAADYTISPNPVSFAARTSTGDMQTSMKVTIMAEEDEDIGEEMLTLDFEVTPVSLTNGPASDRDKGNNQSALLTISDGTIPLVSVKDDAYDAIKEALGDPPKLYMGMSGELMTDDLFTYDATAVDVSFGASVEGAAVTANASPDMVTIMGAAAGDAKVTVTATARPTSLDVIQDRANVAQLTFPVMVELADLTITLSGPEDMNLVEGMSYEISAMANRAVTEDTMVELVQTDGTASPSDYMVENIMIMEGEMMGSTMLMVNADEMMENADNMAEMLTLEGRVGAMKTNALSFYLWDAAVPALPVIAQLLLAGLLGVGGYRRYRRR